MKVFIPILFFSLFLGVHGQSISGRVTYSNGKPVIGASVRIKEKGGVVGSATDINGVYHFEIDSTCITLCVSFFGCFPEEREIRNKHIVNVILKEKPVELINIEVVAHLDRNFDVLRIDKRLKDTTILLLNYICNSIDYPLQAIKYGIEGKVLAKFKIDSSDLSCKVEIIRGIDKLIDNNVKEAILSFTEWKSVILTDEMIHTAISPDIYGFSFWVIPEREYVLPVIFRIVR